MSKTALFTFILAIVFLSMPFFLLSQQEKATPPVSEDSSVRMKLQEDVSSIFVKNCAISGCHRGKFPKKKLNLEADQFVTAMVNVTSLQVDSLKMVDTASPEKSYLLKKVKGGNGIVGDRMPEDAPPLKEEEIKTIEKWIASLKTVEKSKSEKSSSKDDTKK